LFDQRQEPSRPEHTPSNQRGSAIEKLVSAYAAAATAAGVSLLALTPVAVAKIVYTPANVTIPVNGGLVPLDLDHNGTPDFSFSNVRSSSGRSGGSILKAFGKASNAIWGRGQFWPDGVFASALRAGLTVGTNKSHFQKGSEGWLMCLNGGAGAAYSHSTTTYGQWLYAKRRYLGLKFMVNGQVHYGWARFSVMPPAPGNLGLVATLTGYAYETIPNKPIITGKTKGPDVITLEPATLGRLAQGASGVSVWRKSGGSWTSIAPSGPQR
jgi:hypothetical protein